MTIQAGTRLGQYEIVSPLGAGGMGEVYRATDTRLGREVALKVLPEEFLEGEEGKQRFEREARALASLNHPNVAIIHSFEEIPGSSPSSSRHILVMELLEGTTLRDKLESGPIPPKQSVDFALQIAKGLSAAHEKGIVHRDLKPENLFVSKDGHLKILDFGLAKRTEREKTGDETSAPTESKHTEPGVVMGTVAYMSPEQVRGLPVDLRSDIFSFGAILYELLSGKKAFKRDTASDTMAAIMRDEPPKLSESGRNISPALDRVVKHCLEKDRSNRFQSAKDIAFALSEASGQAMSSGAQVVAPASGKTKTLVAAVVVVILAAVGVFLIWRSKRTATEVGGLKRIAVLPFENLGAAADGYFADGMTDEVRSKLAALSGLTVIASASSGQYKATTKAPEQIAKELGVGYLLLAKVRWQKSGSSSRIRVTPELVDVSGGGAPTTRWQEPFDADLSDVFKVQGEIAAKVAKSLDVVLSGNERGALKALPTSNLAAYDAYLKGIGSAEAGNDARAGMAQFEQAVALDPGFALAWASISFRHSFIFAGINPSQQEAEAAKKAAERAMELAPELPMSSFALGMYHRLVREDHSRALEVMSRGLKIAPQDIPLLNRESESEAALGRWEDALAHLRRSQELDPRGYWTDWLLGDFLLRLRRTAEAREAIDRGLALAPALVNLLETKTETYLQQGDLAGARAAIAAAPKEVEPTAFVAFLASDGYDFLLDEGQLELLLRLTPSAFKDDRGEWGLALASAWARCGDTAKAREYAEQARSTLATQVADAPAHARRRVMLGLALAHLGRREEAVKEGEKAIALLPISKDALGGPGVRHRLVLIHILVGEQEKALDELELLLKIPYGLSPAWLRIDPNFDPLRENPRFQKLVAGK